MHLEVTGPSVQLHFNFFKLNLKLEHSLVQTFLEWEERFTLD